MTLMFFLQQHNPHYKEGSIKPEWTHRERLEAFVFTFFFFLSSVHLEVIEL
jgi:hypothetical protein